MIDWTSIAKSVTQLGIFFVAGELEKQARPASIGPPPQMPVHQHQEPGDRQGCPVCDIDDALWEARGKLEQVKYLSEQGGEVPREVRPLVVLAQQSMTRARSMTVRLREQVPRLGQHCDETTAAIDRALGSLPDPDTMTLEQASSAAGVIEDANHRAGDLALRYYRADNDYRGHQRLTDLYEQARSENMDAERFYERLQELLSE